MAKFTGYFKRGSGYYTPWRVDADPNCEYPYIEVIIDKVPAYLPPDKALPRQLPPELTSPSPIITSPVT
jgi:hypothetical protein